MLLLLLPVVDPQGMMVDTTGNDCRHTENGVRHTEIGVSHGNLVPDVVCGRQHRCVLLSQ